MKITHLLLEYSRFSTSTIFGSKTAANCDKNHSKYAKSGG